MKVNFNPPPWWDVLNEEDLNFIRRFILCSGSLKDLAGEYGISYPTLRIRLDRLIDKIKAVEDPAIRDSFHLKIKLMVADGQLPIHTAKTILNEYKKSLTQLHKADGNDNFSGTGIKKDSI